MTFAATRQTSPASRYSEVLDVRDLSTVFSAIVAYTVQSFGPGDRRHEPSSQGYEVSGQYVQSSGIAPFLGRLLQTSDDDHPNAKDVAVLSWPRLQERLRG